MAKTKPGIGVLLKMQRYNNRQSGMIRLEANRRAERQQQQLEENRAVIAQQNMEVRRMLADGTINKFEVVMVTTVMLVAMAAPFILAFKWLF